MVYSVSTILFTAKNLLSSTTEQSSDIVIGHDRLIYRHTTRPVGKCKTIQISEPEKHADYRKSATSEPNIEKLNKLLV